MDKQKLIDELDPDKEVCTICKKHFPKDQLADIFKLDVGEELSEKYNITSRFGHMLCPKCLEELEPHMVF